MVTRDYMLKAALKSRTQVGDAFLKALGYTRPTVNSRRSKKRAKYVNGMRYKDLDKCRKQSHGVTWHDD